MMLFPPKNMIYLYILMYSLLILIMLCMKDLIWIWVMMETMMLFFLGMSFSTSTTLSSVMTYFILQSLASVLLLLFLVQPSMTYSSTLFFYLLLYFKMALYPYFIWYLPVLTTLSPLPLYLVMTVQKLPPLLFSLNNYMYMSHHNLTSFFIFFLILSAIYSSLGALMVLDLQSMLVWSSLMNSCWMFLASILNFKVLLMYLLIYSAILLYFIDITQKSNYSLYHSLMLCMMILIIAGFPPFPMFFLKLYIIMSLSAMSPDITLALFTLMLFSVVMLCLYLRQFIMKVYPLMTKLPSL